MKKILLMLAMLLPCVGAIAQIQPSTTDDLYLYKNQEQEKHLYGCTFKPYTGQLRSFCVLCC